MKSILCGLALWLGRRALRDRRGSVALVAAISMFPLLIAAGVAIDMSRLTDARSALQRAADNAALSGAAAYVLYTQADSFNATARTVAHSAFCNAVTALPAGFTLGSPSGSTSCSRLGPGPAVSAVIGGFKTGARGTVANSGCSGSMTVVQGATCGFIVTVAATATVNTIFPALLGSLATVSVTASAVNPFINLATAISKTIVAAAGNANSLWVYPLLLDANGAPDFSTSPGALPNTSACTGNPTQTSCGSYTMLASNYYLNCTAEQPCYAGSTEFINGVVQNPVVGNAVITATTPLGIALQSAAGTVSSFGYVSKSAPQPEDGGNCTWPAPLAYNTVTQAFDMKGYPLVINSNGNWSVVTHWFYSSFLANNNPPDANEIAAQGKAQVVPAVSTAGADRFNPNTTTPGPTLCPNPISTIDPANAEPNMVTSFPTSGATNCALYIAKDPASLQPPSSYKRTSASQTPSCWSPANTPGHQYAALSCQNYAGHNFAFFWNDMSGTGNVQQPSPPFDDTDYGNATLQVSCSGASFVVLIN